MGRRSVCAFSAYSIKGEGFGEGKFVPCVPSWTEKIMNDFR